MKWALFLYNRKLLSYYIKNAPLRMRTRAYRNKLLAGTRSARSVLRARHFLGKLHMNTEVKYQLPNGTKLNNRYIIQDVIGEGGFGITYKAYDELINSQVAIKEMYAADFMTRDVTQSLDVINLTSDEAKKNIKRCRDSFANEVSIMERIKNIPYVSRIKDHFSSNNTEYIVMRLLTGCTLSEYVKSKHEKFNTELVLSSIEHILIALEEIHEMGIIHKDICPGNLFLTSDKDLYLIDFGCSYDAEFSKGIVFEHKGFHAPEYNDVSRQGAWTDIYSLCATIVYLITGDAVPLPEDRTVQDIVPQIVMCKHFTTKQQNALIHGLQIDINRRCKSVRDLRISLCGNVNEKSYWKEVRYAVCTNTGTRKINQDNLMLDGIHIYDGYDFSNSGIIHCEQNEIHIAAVCDGVSNASSGELASKAVAQALRHLVKQYRNSDTLPERLIEEFLDQVNEKIISLSKKIGRTATTVSFVLWKDNQYYAVNIGDSPIYLLRNRKLQLLSNHHTLFNTKLMEGGELSVKDKHTLMNYVGKEKVAGSQMYSYRHGYLEKGDRFLICTDGITDAITDDRIKKYLHKKEDLAIRDFQKIISKNRLSDNYTAIILAY